MIITVKLHEQNEGGSAHTVINVKHEPDKLYSGTPQIHLNLLE